MVKKVSKSLFAAAVVLCVLFSQTNSLKRKLHTTFWPNCKDFKTSCQEAKSLGLNLVYTKASTDHHDDLHYVFSTIGIPTISITRTTGADANYNFNWDELLSPKTSNKDSITFPKTKGLNVEYKYAVAFTSLLQYNDTHDHADLDSKDLPPGPQYWTISDFRDFLWDSLPSDKSTDEFVFNTTSDFISPRKSNNGSLSFSFKPKAVSGRASELPALPFSANETLFDFVMANYTPTYEKSRFALEAVFVSSSKNHQMSVDTTRSIDDEYSPGVFQITNLLSDPGSKQSAGFMQWKPVAYLATSRERKSATKVRHYSIKDISTWDRRVEQVNQSIIPAIFGDVWSSDGVLVRASNVSFGLTNDGFYNLNNYTAWSAAIGYGSPPVDSISTTVIIIISAGLGIPVLIILFGGIYTCVRRARQASGYQVIGNSSPDHHVPQIN